ncbi:MAG: glyoxalase [Arenibacter latericius]|uniref:glyoxalase n=1 Tax=Arenibacter TaxID=178469 RepID=UPI000A3B93D1|nr:MULTISPECIES: glyoxalase [Arenibacter]MDX1365888.1 glyoxalase [Arenibacter latericius]
MKYRSHYLLEIRPVLPNAVVTENMSMGEKFQNKTLRPILKLQNPLLVLVLKNYIAKHKNGFYDLSPEKRLLFIENSIQKDIKFRNSLKGILIGQFTEEEYELYIQNSSALNKRMMNMVIARLQDQIQQFDHQPLPYV